MNVRRTIVLAVLLALLSPLAATAFGGPGEMKPPAEEMTISVALWDLAEWGKDPVSQKISADLKIRLEIMPLSWDNAEEQTNLWAAAGTLPDCTATYTTDQDINRFYSWIDQGIIRAIPEKMVAKYPTVKKVFDGYSVLQGVKQIKGGYYFIPRPESLSKQYKADQTALYYRTDWAKKLGIAKRPESLDDFYAMAKAFTQKDPDGNGKNDTYGITSPKGSMMYDLFGYDIEAWMVEDGKWIPAIVSKRTPANIAFVQKLYREGLWDREFSLNGWRQAVQKFSQGTFGILLRNADVYWINRVIVRFFGPANPGIPDPLAAVGLMGPFTVEGRKAGWPQKNETCGTEISAKVDDKKLDRILMLTEYLMSPQAKEVAHFGILGEDYTVVDGKPQPKIDPATNAPIAIASKYPSFSIFSFSDWDFDWDIAEPGNLSIAPAIKKLAAENRARYNAAAVSENLAIRLMSTPAKDELTVFGTWRDSFDQIVQGSEDAATAWKKFVDENMAKGLAKAIDEVNAIAKQKGIKP